MDQTFIEILKGISIPGSVAVVAYFVVKPLVELFAQYIKSKMTASGQPMTSVTMDDLDRQIKLLGSNHFHEVKDSLDRIEDLLQSINDRSLVILTKLNGKNNY